MASLVDRMMRAAKLDAAVYEEIEADQNAMGQAVIVVVLGSVAAGIAAVGTTGVQGLVVSLIGALIGWAVWAGITFFVGTKMLAEPQTKADFPAVLRVLGFASAPGVLRILGIIPIAGPLINLAIAVWMLVATVIATRQVLDYSSTGRAVAVCLVGWVVMLLTMLVFMVVVGGAAVLGGAAVS